MKQILFITLLFLASLSLWPGTLMEVETRTLSGEDFLFPHDALKEGLAIFALAMSTTQKNG